MFKILVFYITILYVIVLNAKKCKEYILIISEDIFCPPVKLNKIDWHEFACPHNSPDVLTYEEFSINGSCVLELTCNNGVYKYDNKYNPSRYKGNICIPNERTTTEATTTEPTSSKITTNKTSTTEIPNTETITTDIETTDTTTTETKTTKANTTDVTTTDIAITDTNTTETKTTEANTSDVTTTDIAITDTTTTETKTTEANTTDVTINKTSTTETPNTETTTSDIATTDTTTTDVATANISTIDLETTETKTTEANTTDVTTTKTATSDKTTTEPKTTDTATAETFSVENNDNTAPTECNTDIHNNTCERDTTVKDDIINPNEINLYIGFDKRRDSKIVMRCDYIENICINDKNNDSIRNSASSLKTIIVSLVKGNISKYDLENNDLNKNLKKFNCTSFYNNTDVLNKQYVAFTYEIMKIINCNYNTDTEHKVNRKLTIYAQSNGIFNNKKENFIKCAQHFILLDKQTVSIECETLKIPELNGNSDKIYDTTELTNSLIWNCDYKSPDYAIMCDKEQSQKYKLLNFQNCTGYHDSKNKHLNNYNFIINLNNTDKYLVAKRSHKKNRKIGPFSDNFQMHFLSNDSSCVDLNKLFYISKGRVFNLWTNDEENMIRKNNNNYFLININLINCTIHNHVTNNNSTGHLKLDIILNKQNSTNLSIFKENDFNETEDIHKNRAIVNCMFPDINNKTLGKYPKLEVYCNLKCIDYLNDTSDASNNKSRTEFGSVEFFPIGEEFLQTIDKEKQYSGNINTFPFESTTDFNIYQHLKPLKTSAQKTDEIPENKSKTGTKTQNPQNINKPTIKLTNIFNIYPILLKTTTPEAEEIPENKDNNTDKEERNSLNIDKFTTNFSTNEPSKLFETTRGDDDISEQQINNVTTEKDETTATKYSLNHSQYTITEASNKYTDLTRTTATESSTQNKHKEIYTTEATKTTTIMHKIHSLSGLKGVKNNTNVETTETSPFLYLGAILGTICIISIVAIIGIKIWKPSHIYYGVAKRDDNRDNEETQL